MFARVFELFDLRSFSVRLAILCLLSLLSAAGAFAQDPTPQPTETPEIDPKRIDVKTDLITLTLTVTDLYGRYVSGLTKQAFTIQDDGKEQEITFFSDADSPASVGILFDVSGSMSGDKIAKARNALSKFINTSHPSDEYFLIAFNKRA